MPDILPVIQTTDTADSPIFDRFYRSYEKAFVLPDEMESRDGFAACLAQNHGARFQHLAAQFGSFREICATACEPGTGALIGGANFIALPHPATGKGRFVSANLNYIFIEPAMRGRGWFHPLIKALQSLIGGLFPVAAPDLHSDTLVFIEQNDPLRMGAEAYRRDSLYSGIDQFDRLRIWAGQGARMVDFPYVQPPLSAGQEPDENLVYSVIGAPEDRLSACALYHHLRSFFSISVLKGQDIQTVPSAQNQIAILEEKCRAGVRIGLIDPRDRLAGLSREDAMKLVEDAPRTLLTWLRSEAG